VAKIMRYEWDQNKNFANQKKHGISFDEAIEIFDDPLHVSVLDEKYSYFEERWITVGNTKNISIVVVVNLFFSDEGEEVIRVISAREATNNERKNYEGT
jgi:uncharacterized protein